MAGEISESESGRYRTLDGFRGLAAIAVVFCHAQPHDKSMLPAGYLAVDLFFLLSGFVIERSYGARLKAGLGFRSFAVLRAVRLYPLYLAGLLVGYGYGVFSLLMGGGYEVVRQMLLSLPNFLFLPFPPVDQGKVWPLFPLNLPFWSLFFELLVNGLYAALLVRFSSRMLALLLVPTGLILAAGIFHVGSADLGSVWGHLGWGFARTLYSFLIGVLIARTPMARSRSLAAELLLAGLGALFVLYAGRQALPDMAIVFAGFPLLVLLAARYEPRFPRPHEVLGKISYPLYCIHLPILYLQIRITNHIGLDPVLSCTVTILALVVAAYLADVLYDEPVRAWLKARLRRRRARVPEPASA